MAKPACEKVGRFITIERDGGVATVIIDRGDGLNALSIELLRDIASAARSFTDDLDTTAIVLTGARAFSAGADLKDPAQAERAKAGLLERRHWLRAGPEACDAWEVLDQLVIAAVETFCIGGGVAIAAACDLRIAGASAYFRLPEVPLGMNMSWHTIPRLVNLMGPARTKRFVVFGEKLDAATAAMWGFADEVVPDGQALAVALAMAKRAAALPPIPVRMTKRAVTQAATALNATATFMDLDQFALAATSDDSREAIVAFLEKRAPKFSGR